MVSGEYAGSPVHDPRLISVLLSVRRTSVYEGPEAVPTEKHAHLVQRHSSCAQYSPRVGGKWGLYINPNCIVSRSSL